MTVDGGATVEISDDSALGEMNAGDKALGQNTLILDGGSTLDFLAGFTLDHAVTVSGDPTFAVSSGQTDTINGLISGSGDVVVTGGGTLALDDDANSYSGGTTIDDASTLELGASGAAGADAITFEGADTLKLEAGVTLANTISGFGLGDTIDIAGVGTETGYTLGASNVLTLTGGASSATLNLDPGANYAGEYFYVRSDNASGTLVTPETPVAPTISVASPADHTTHAGAPVDPFAGDTISDTNLGAPTETLTVTPSASANGALSDPNAATDGSAVDPSTGVFTVTGTALAVTTALDGLVFTPADGAQGSTTTFTISDASSDYPLAITDSTTEVTNAPCFCRGMLILTERGEVAVEDLAIGDRVVTLSGETMPIRWLGRRTVAKRFADPLSSWPIRIKAGALAENVPSRDLMVSPDHALLVDDVLIQAGALVNGTSIVREIDVAETFVYYHVELDDHSLIFAEGAPAETFVDNVDRMNFDNWAEFEALYPDGRTVEELPYPRAKAFRQVPAHIRPRLDECAKTIALARETIAA